MPIFVHVNVNEQIFLVQYCKPLLGQWNFNIGIILGQDCNVVWEGIYIPSQTVDKYYLEQPSPIYDYLT